MMPGQKQKDPTLRLFAAVLDEFLRSRFKIDNAAFEVAGTQFEKIVEPGLDGFCPTLLGTVCDANNRNFGKNERLTYGAIKQT